MQLNVFRCAHVELEQIYKTHSHSFTVFLTLFAETL